MLPDAQGQFSPQPHVAIPEGLYEEEFGRDGFYGPVSHLYHRHAPTGWTRIEGPLRPHAIDALKATLPSQPHIQGRVPLLYNPDVVIQMVTLAETTSWLFRNADGDELFFVHVGSGTLETDFGHLAVEPGDYVSMPKGTTHRFVVDSPLQMLLYESPRPFLQPERGLLGRHALYDPFLLETPTLQPAKPSPQPGAEWEIKIKRMGQLTSVFYPFDPLDIAGWKGDLAPFRLNVRDIRPVMSHRVHLPPSVHSTFKTDQFVICTFLPRPLESDPEAMRVPFYHRNIDYDEVIFYHSGDFFSRDGIQPGMMTFHPQGIHHGPHPKAKSASTAKTETEEIAVMIDTVRPLLLTPAAEAVEWQAYWQSWQPH